jgi:hypothetical protein
VALEGKPQEILQLYSRLLGAVSRDGQLSLLEEERPLGHQGPQPEAVVQLLDM